MNPFLGTCIQKLGLKSGWDPRRFSYVTVLAGLLASVALPAAASKPTPTLDGRGSLGQAGIDFDPWIREAGRGRMELRQPSVVEPLRLGAGISIDPLAADPEAVVPRARRAKAVGASEPGYFLVQFVGPVTNSDRNLVEAEGGKILCAIPRNALLVRTTGEFRMRLASSPRVRWSGDFHPAYKVAPRLQDATSGRQEILILLFPDARIDVESAALVALGGVIQETSVTSWNKILRAELDVAAITEVARRREVAWIEPYDPPQFFNANQQWVVQTWTSNFRRIWDQGILGSGQVVNVVDSGIRVTHLQFVDPVVPIPDFGDYPTHRKIIAYKKTLEIPNILFLDEAHNTYHGTHTSCTAAGSDDESGGTSTNDGNAKSAKIYFQDGGGTATGIFIPSDLNELFIHPYNGNAGGAARISSNSWGSASAGAYTISSMTADQFMWDHPDFLICFANGNSGPGGNTVGAPASAKSVVSVGGTQNGASAGSMYNSTSRGPTDDGRRKPTVCAPGQGVSSAMGGSDAAYWSLTGTSMACPGVAGVAALMRDYLNSGWYPTGAAVPSNAIAEPSAALLKAMAVNSGDNLSFETMPSNNIGWGRVHADDVLYFAGDLPRVALVDNTNGILAGEFVEYEVQVAGTSVPLKASLVWTDYPGSPTASIQLVNNLDLSATDGSNVYKGNVYSGGQSVTGGSFDDLNVVEGIEVANPALGTWTFRVEAPDVPFGPQSFALVVTGELASDAAHIVLDQPVYGGSGSVTIRVVDLDAGPSVVVTATSNTEPATETVVLPGSDGVYVGTLSLSLTDPVSENGTLSVSHGDQIRVTYEDTSPVGTLGATALVDLNGPAISDVVASDITERSALVTWTTNAAANSKVYYGTTPALGSESALDPGLVLDHGILLQGLESNTLYYFDVESIDRPGNGVRDDRAGSHYTFSTDFKRDVLVVIGDATFGQRNYYEAALDAKGWTHTVWEGAAAANPLVGDLAQGLAAYKAVVWQTGLEQYPMFSDVQRSAVSAYNAIGSRLAVYSHDVAWDFSDPTSPDFSSDRLQWFNNEMHAAYTEDPGTWSINHGIASDPISGSYVSGIPYSPHRSGAAGDEIQGIAGTGSFAYVWRDNDTTADNVALRWTGGGPVGNPSLSVWGGTANRFVGNFFELVALNAGMVDDAIRADVLDQTIIWLIGHDHPTLDLSDPNGGEVFTGNQVPITWTESFDTGFGLGSRRIYYSRNSGAHWVEITPAAGSSPYSWDTSAIPNGSRYRVRVVLEDDGMPALIAQDASASDFTISRPGGDTEGPIVQSGSIVLNPNPVRIGDPASIAATVSDVLTGNSNVVAAEWSLGATAAVAGNGNAMSGSFDSPTVGVSAAVDTETLSPGQRTFWVRGQDAGGAWGEAGSVVVTVNGTPTAVALVPRRTALHVNWPNPFNPMTQIAFDLAEAASIELDVFDVAGRHVRRLVAGRFPTGFHRTTWDGRDNAGRAMASGIYLYRLETGSFQSTRKMALLR